MLIRSSTILNFSKAASMLLRAVDSLSATAIIRTKVPIMTRWPLSTSTNELAFLCTIAMPVRTIRATIIYIIQFLVLFI